MGAGLIEPLGTLALRARGRSPEDIFFDLALTEVVGDGRHDLDAGDDRIGQVPRRRDHFIQHAVRLDANFEFVLERFEMQVARVLANRHQEHHI